MPQQVQIIRKPIHPPQAGVVRKFGFQAQPPYSTIKSVNFLPFNAIDGRRVSATRPPLKLFGSPSGASGTVNLLKAINGDAGQTPQQAFIAAEAGKLYRWAGGTSYEEVDQGLSSVPLISTGRAVFAATMIFETVIANNGDVLVYNNSSDPVFNTAGVRRLYTLSSIVTTGTAPYDCRVAANWQGCVWLAGSSLTPHLLFGSRTGDITDWDYLVDDEGGAFATAGDNEGLLGGPIVALIPQTADSMIVGCEDGMFILRGHPRRGGIMEVLSSTIGPLGQGAWCKLPDDTLFIMTKTGIVTLESSSTATPTEVSRQRLPDDLISLIYESSNPKVNLCYDTRYRMVHINVRGEEEQAWYYDIENGGFYEQEYAQSTLYPTVMLAMPSLDSADASGALYGNDDGIFRLNLDTPVEVISCTQLMGPIKISETPTRKSKIIECKTILDIESGLNGFQRLWCGQDGQEVYNQATSNRPRRMHEDTLEDVQRNNGVVKPAIAGHALIYEITGTVSGNPIVFESAEIGYIDAGVERDMRDLAVQPEVSAGSDLTIQFT
jgi:hypothetical protein